MYLLAEHDLGEVLQIATNVAVLVIIPWVITVERRLATLIAFGKNGLHKHVENLQSELKDQRNEYGKRINKLEIKLATLEGGQGDSAIQS